MKQQLGETDIPEERNATVTWTLALFFFQKEGASDQAAGGGLKASGLLSLVVQWDNEANNLKYVEKYIEELTIYDHT